MLKDVFLDDKTQGVRKTTNPSTLNLVHYKPEAFNCGVSGPRGLLFSLDNHPERSPTRRSLSRWLISARRRCRRNAVGAPLLKRFKVGGSVGNHQD